MENNRKLNNKEKVGGRAYSNGLRLMNSKWSVKAYYDKNNNLRVKTGRVKRGKYYKYIKKIPVLRGIVSLMLAIAMFLKESTKNPRKYWVVLLIIFLDIIIIFLPASTGGDTVNLIMDIIFILYLVLPVILIIAFRKVIVEILKYHGAEHKAVNYYENDCQGDIQSYSRLHRRCGSNIVFYYILISLVVGSFDININIWLQELIYLGLAYEAIKYTPEKLLFIPYLFQRIVTREPEDKHIEAARLALDVLDN